MRSNENIKAADLYASMVYITLFRYLRNSLDLNEQDVDFVQCLRRQRLTHNIYLKTFFKSLLNFVE